MELIEARVLLDTCQQDRILAQVEEQRARAKRESATLIIQGILRQFPELESEVSTADREWEIRISDAPGGAEAVLQILQVDEGQPYTVREMVAALDRRGWLPQSENPANAVRTALERLRGQTKGVNKGRDTAGVVVYYYEEPPPPQANSGGYGFDEEPF
jgi:hypothetical protein